jgi:hypothetical protein
VDLYKKILELDSVYEGEGQQPGGFTTNNPNEAIKEIVRRMFPGVTAQIPISENLQLNLGPVNEISAGGQFDVGGGKLSIGGGMRGDEKGFGINFRKEFSNGSLSEEYYGKSQLAYQKAVDDGFQGTYEEYLRLISPTKSFADGGRAAFKNGNPNAAEALKAYNLKLRNQRTLDLQNFISNFQTEYGRLPTQNEIRTLGKFDYQFIKDRINDGSIKTLSTREAKVLGRKKVDTKEIAKKTVATKTKNQPYIVTKGGSQTVGEVLDVVFPNEKMKNEYLNDLRKIFAQKYRRTRYKAPGVLTTKQLAEKYFGNSNDFTISKIGKMNTYFANELGLSFENLPIETKSAETTKRRRDRIVKARKELSPREKLINTQQDNLVNQINNYYRKFPNLIIQNEPLSNAILSRMNPDGTLSLKTFNSFDEKNNYLKKIALSDVGTVSVDHITDVQLEKKNVEFPINRQLAPVKTNQSVVTRAKNLLKNNLNKTDSASKTIVSNVINSLNDLGLRVNVGGKVYGSELTPAIDTAKGTLPNMDKSINKFNLSESAKNFKINPNLIKATSETIGGTDDINNLRPLANIGCPNKKADGGRVNFADGQDLVACAIKGAEKLQNTDPKKLDPLAKSNIKTLTKTAQGARFLKNVLGPGALAFEGLFALPFAALDFAEGRAGSDILKNALSLGLMDSKLRQDELKEFFAGAGKGEEFINALESVKNLSKQLSGTKKQRQRAIPKYNIAFDNFEKAMQPFMRVNPQLESGQMFSPELLDENLRKTEEAKQKVLETYDERLKDRGIGKYAEPFDFSYGEFSNGGIAGLSGGDKSGPPPERGPDSEGLRSLMKRGINL